MLMVLLRNCVEFLRWAVVNRLSVAATRVERQWHRLVLRFLTIRRLQWRFAFIGHYLQIYPRSLLDRLQRHYPRQ